MRLPVAATLLGLASVAQAACGGPEPSPEAPSGRPAAGASSAPERAATPAPFPGDGGLAEQATPAPPAAEALPARDSHPPGVSPLSDEEKQTLSGACKPFVDALVRAATKKGKRSRAEASRAVEGMLDDPPRVSGVDVPRCAGLMRRELVAYRARAIEIDALANLKTMVLALAAALERESLDEDPAKDVEKHCPAAPPVPASLEVLSKGPYQPVPGDWDAPGWRCLKFSLERPTRFQYELIFDPKTNAFEAIARGYPVEGEAPTELFIRGRREPGGADPSAPVLRRKAR